MSRPSHTDTGALAVLVACLFPALLAPSAACTARRVDFDEEPPVVAVAGETPEAAPARAVPTGPFDFDSAAPDWNPEGIAWRTLEAGLAEARQSGKPILMVMHAEWCGHCRNYSRVFHDGELTQLARQFVMVSVDTDRDPGANQRYATDGTYLPRTYVLDSNGQHRAEIQNGRDRFRYFFDERNPGPTVAAMRSALP